MEDMATIAYLFIIGLISLHMGRHNLPTTHQTSDFAQLHPIDSSDLYKCLLFIVSATWFNMWRIEMSQMIYQQRELLMCCCLAPQLSALCTSRLCRAQLDTAVTSQRKTNRAFTSFLSPSPFSSSILQYVAADDAISHIQLFILEHEASQ